MWGLDLNDALGVLSAVFAFVALVLSGVFGVASFAAPESRRYTAPLALLFLAVAVDRSLLAEALQSSRTVVDLSKGAKLVAVGSRFVATLSGALLLVMAYRGIGVRFEGRLGGMEKTLDEVNEKVTDIRGEVMDEDDRR